MKLSIPTWYPQVELDGLLYFAQRLDEMLFHYTIDLYKAPVLNTHLLLTEYLGLLYNKEIGDKYLSYILDEIKLSLTKDPVVNRYWGRDNTTKVVQTLKNSSKQVQSSMIDYIYRIFGGEEYHYWCYEYLKELVLQDKKDKIEQVMKCYIPELIGRGYSSEYIYNFNKKCLLETSNPSMDLFINRFDFKKRKYKVYIAADKWINSFRSLFSEHLRVSFMEDENYKKLKHKNNQVVFHIDDIEALDDNNAAQIAFEKLNIFLRFYSAVDNKKQPRFSDKAMVFEGDSTTPSFVSFGMKKYNVIEGMRNEVASEFTEQLINNLVTYAKCSLGQLFKACDLHNFSLKNPDYNSAFINLWSVLEVLSIKELGTNHLEQVTGTLLPILEKRYYNSLINDFASKINFALSKEYKKLLSELTEHSSELEKIAEFLFLDKYDTLRKNYSAVLTHYPVLRYRIHIYSEAANSKKQLLSLGENYKQRVEWHLSRIYRIRNSIAHSGASPQSIRYIGEHLHYYVDILMMEAFTKLTSGVHFCSVSNALLDSLLAWDTLKNLLNRKEEIKIEDIKMLINPTFTSHIKFTNNRSCEEPCPR